MFKPDYESRYLKLRKYMSENSIDAMYITSAENFLYYSGFDNPDGFMVIKQDISYAVSDFRYIEAAKKNSFPVCTVEMLSANILSDIINCGDIKTIGIENNNLTITGFNDIKNKAVNNQKFKNVDNTISYLRAVKDEYEIDSIIKAQRIAEKSLKQLMDNFSDEMTELDLTSELEYLMKKNGSEDPAFKTIAVSGVSSSLPHGVPANVKIRKGFLTLDFGAKVNGYLSDMTRTFSVGKADDEMKKIYNTVLKAQIAAEEVIAEGKDAGEMDKTARDIITEAGYGPCFGHSLGHGVGLLIHELPNLSMKTFGVILSKGNIVTCEPGIYVEGKFGCRIEDMILVDNGCNVNLTHYSKDLIEL